MYTPGPTHYLRFPAQLFDLEYERTGFQRQALNVGIRSVHTQGPTVTGSGHLTNVAIEPVNACGYNG